MESISLYSGNKAILIFKITFKNENCSLIHNKVNTMWMKLLLPSFYERVKIL